MSKPLNNIRDEYIAGLERVKKLQALLEANASEPEIQSLLVDLSNRAERIGELTRELERMIQVKFGGV
jgi:dihydroorotate dehydrogenase